MRYEDRTDKSAEPRCKQCGSTSPASGFTTKRVIHRGWDPRTRSQVAQETDFTVCAGTPCGTHLQYAHEG